VLAAQASKPEPFEADWLDALERWAVDPSTWDVEKLGPPLNQPNHDENDSEAKAFGLEVPTSIRVRADEVIE